MATLTTTKAPCCEISDDLRTPNQSVTKDVGRWIRLGLSILIAGQSMIWGLAINISELKPFSSSYWIIHGALGLTALLSIVLCGQNLLKRFISVSLKREITLETLFTISLMGALIGSLWATFSGSGSIYYEVVAFVVVIYTFGDSLGDWTKSKALAEVDRFKSQFGIARIANSSTNETRPIDEINSGDSILVYPGDAFPVDCTIKSGAGFVKTTPITGEPLPVSVGEGDHVEAGSFSIDGNFTATVSGTKNSKISSIISSVESVIAIAGSRRENQAAKWIQAFVWVVLFTSAATFLFWYFRNLEQAVLNSMSVLLVACPCALGLSTPLAIWSALWKMSEKGITTQSSKVIDGLSNCRHIFLDKTGTITKSDLAIKSVRYLPNEIVSESELMQIAKTMQQGFDHPISRAFQKHPSKLSQNTQKSITSREWHPGRGVTAALKKNGKIHQLKLGDPGWAGENANSPKDRVVLVIDDASVAEFSFAESLRDDARNFLDFIKKEGISATILTGDKTPEWDQIEGILIRSGLTPKQKQEFIDLASQKGQSPIFIGDGINDLPAMSKSSLSVAVEDGGSALTRSSADAVIRGPGLYPLIEGIKIARKVERTFKSNLKIAVGYNSVGITLAALGFLHPVAAVLIMLVSSLLVTLRAATSAEA